MYDVKTFLARVEKLRDLRSLSEKEYSERSNHEFQANLIATAHDGISRKMLLEQVIIAADILDTSVDYLLGRTIDPRPGLRAEDIL